MGEKTPIGCCACTVYRVYSIALRAVRFVIVDQTRTMARIASIYVYISNPQPEKVPPRNIDEYAKRKAEERDDHRPTTTCCVSARRRERSSRGWKTFRLRCEEDEAANIRCRANCKSVPGK